jgi:hypothetical protein
VYRQAAYAARGRPPASDPVKLLDQADVARAALYLAETEPSQADAVLRMASPGWVRSEHIDELAEEVQRGLAYLKSIAPKPPEGFASTKWKPTLEESMAFNDRLRGALRPEAAVDDLRRWKVNPRTVEAVAAVHPAALEEQRRVIRAEFQRAVASGTPFTAGERLQVATFLGDHRVAHPVHQPEFRAVLDELQAGAVQERGAMRPPRRSIRFADRNQGRAQAALEGSV